MCLEKIRFYIRKLANKLKEQIVDTQLTSFEPSMCRTEKLYTSEKIIRYSKKFGIQIPSIKIKI